MRNASQGTNAADHLHSTGSHHKRFLSQMMANCQHYTDFPNRTSPNPGDLGKLLPSHPLRPRFRPSHRPSAAPGQPLDSHPHPDLQTDQTQELFRYKAPVIPRGGHHLGPSEGLGRWVRGEIWGPEICGLGLKNARMPIFARIVGPRPRIPGPANPQARVHHPAGKSIGPHLVRNPAQLRTRPTGHVLHLCLCGFAREPALSALNTTTEPPEQESQGSVACKYAKAQGSDLPGSLNIGELSRHGQR